METPAQQPFDDPRLREAIRQAWGQEQAPAALRQRVQALIAPPPPAPSAWHNPLYPLAAAALLVLAIGGGWYYYQGVVQYPGPEIIQPTLASALSQAHDRCCFGGDHHQIAAPRTDFTAISTALEAQINHPVFAGDLDDGWRFEGASLCSVGPFLGAHLVYSRGEQTISVFTLPGNGQWSAADDRNTQFTTHDGHQVAAFAHGDTLYCVVGSSPNGNINLSDVLGIRSQIRTSPAACRHR